MVTPNDVIVIKTFGGEFLIGTLVSKPEDNENHLYIIEEARVIQIQLTPTGAAVGFTPLFPFGNLKDKQVKIKDSNVLVAAIGDEIDIELVNGYISKVTGLDLSAAGGKKLVVPDKF